MDGILGTHNLLADPSARFVDLGPDVYEHRVNKHRRTHNLIRQLQAVGHAKRQCVGG